MTKVQRLFRPGDAVEVGQSENHIGFCRAVDPFHSFVSRRLNHPRFGA